MSWVACEYSPIFYMLQDDMPEINICRYIATICLRWSHKTKLKLFSSGWQLVHYIVQSIQIQSSLQQLISCDTQEGKSFWPACKSVHTCEQILVSLDKAMDHVSQCVWFQHLHQVAQTYRKVRRYVIICWESNIPVSFFHTLCRPFILCELTTKETKKHSYLLCEDKHLYNYISVEHWTLHANGPHLNELTQQS